MSEIEPPTTPTEREAAERRATRRRWLTLAEVLGVAALLISAATLWNNITARRGEEADRAAEKAAAAKAAAEAARAGALVSLQAKVADDGEALLLSDAAGHSVQSIDIRFPPALGIGVRESVLEPRIDADWFAAGLLRATDGGPDAIEGRLPVAITSSYWSGGDKRSDTAIYDIIFRTQGRMLGGRELRLRGIVLRERVEGSTGARLDMLWTAERKRLEALK